MHIFEYNARNFRIWVFVLLLMLAPNIRDIDTYLATSEISQEYNDEKRSGVVFDLGVAALYKVQWWSGYEWEAKAYYIGVLKNFVPIWVSGVSAEMAFKSYIPTILLIAFASLLFLLIKSAFKRWPLRERQTQTQ